MVPKSKSADATLVFIVLIENTTFSSPQAMVAYSALATSVVVGTIVQSPVLSKVP